MKLKKVLVLTLAMTLWGGSMIFADSATQAVKILFNGSDLGENGLVSDGKTYLPLRQLAQQMQALVVWDESSKKVGIVKPNVHMFLFQGNNPFGGVETGKKVTFSVFAQVDSLFTDIQAFKITIADPSGKETLIQQDTLASKKDNFWYRTNDFKYTFDASGTYSIHFYMRLSTSDDWSSVSEKNILVK